MSHEIVGWVASVTLSYLVGAIPTGYLMGRALKGVDIRKAGSGNVGATNVIRVVGKGPGIFTLLFDIGKGAASVLVIAPLFAKQMDATLTDVELACGIAAVCGHNWTCFLNFRGGKGIAASGGVFLALAPLVALCLLGVWIFFAVITRYVSVASIMASVALPILLFAFDKPSKWLVAGFILSWVSIWKHRGNIRRLMQGTENRMAKK